MRVPSHPTQIRRMLQSRLQADGPDQPGAGRQPGSGQQTLWPACLCPAHKGGPVHQAHHLTLKQNGKTHTVSTSPRTSFRRPKHGSPSINASRTLPS